MTSHETVEQITREVTIGNLTLPSALLVAYLDGYNEGWSDAQRLRAAEIKRRRGKRSTRNRRNP